MPKHYASKARKPKAANSPVRSHPMATKVLGHKRRGTPVKTVRPKGKPPVDADS